MPRSAPSPLAAVLFDLDGTLVDSVADLAAAANRLLDEHGRPPLAIERIRSFIGDGAARLVDRVLDATGGPPPGTTPALATARFLEIYERAPSALTRPYPGVVEALQTLRARGLKTGVCTNKPAKVTAMLLADLGLDRLFDAVVGGDSYPTRKPSPEPVLGLLATLGVAPDAAAFVGDNEHDAAAARAAGVARVLLVRYGYARLPLEEIDQDGLLNGFAELPAALGLSSA